VSEHEDLQAEAQALREAIEAERAERDAERVAAPTAEPEPVAEGPDDFSRMAPAHATVKAEPTTITDPLATQQDRWSDFFARSAEA
jgi:hypothetical protein